MKRFHVHVHVAGLEESVRFYSTLFGAAPAVIKADYAKWMLKDPPVNFAISSRMAAAGIDHLGFQVESDEDLSEIKRRLDGAGQEVTAQENASCCYARGNKAWVTDPSGISWETFHTLGESTVYGDDTLKRTQPAPEACCSTSPACCAAAASR